MERKTKAKIPNELEGLDDMIFDVYDDSVDSYRQVIYLFKDRITKRRRDTDEVLEITSNFIETETLLENLVKIKNGQLSLERTGYKSWIEQIKKERGIDLMARL